MRWLAMTSVLCAGLLAGVIYEQRQVADLAFEICELREAVMSGPGHVVLSAEEHQVLRQMLGPQRTVLQLPAQPAPAPVAAKAVESEKPQPPTVEQRASADEASHAIDSAISSGTVRPGDLRKVANLLAGVDRAEADRLRSRLAVAVNTDQVHIDPTPQR
jgi:hypothetical protein